MVSGCFYLVSPERISGTFGLKPPASDADTRAWLRLKGIRDPRGWIGRADNDADRGQAVARHSSTRSGHHLSWRHVNHSGVGRVEVASVLNSWRNLRGDAVRRPLVDPCRLREMPLTGLVDREGRIATSHAGVVDHAVAPAKIPNTALRILGVRARDPKVYGLSLHDVGMQTLCEFTEHLC